MLRGEFRAIDAEIPVLRARTMAGHLSDSLSLPRMGVRFLSGFGFVALALAGLGLYGISPADPVTFAFVGAVMLLVAIGAAMIPALRAAKADPVLALRQS